MHFRNIYMKKILIIGYGDIGHRISQSLPGHKIIGVSRSNTIQHSNTDWHQWDWFSGRPLELSSREISTVVVILKPTSFTEEGYKTGYLEAAETIMKNLNQQLDYRQLILVSSTRVYGDTNGRDITETVTPKPEDFRGHTILEYEQIICSQSKVEPLILRPSGLYDSSRKWMQNFVDGFDGQQYPLASKESNRFNRDVLAAIISNYITIKKLAKLSGILICSEPPKAFSQIFLEQYPNKNFKDFFIPSNYSGKSFNCQELIASSLMG
jgi:nucleoside-diphosphate-sugar epimerase